MWPWEHLALGYVLYSLSRRLVEGERPGDVDVVVLAIGTQVPDLIDKPLAWSLDVLPSGLSLGHSVFFALPVSLLALSFAGRYGRRELGLALAVGYLSHLLGDVLYYVFSGGEFYYEFLFWPLVDRPPVEDTSFLAELSSLLVGFQAFLGTPRGRLYLLGELLFLVGVLVLWVRDDFPPLGLLTTATADEPDELGEHR